MTLVEVLRRLRERGVRLRLDGERLAYNAPRGAIDEELRSALREHRSELVAFLRGGDEEGDGMPTLVAAPRDHPLPASFSQERLWFVHQFEAASFLYNEPAALGLRGDLDAVALAGALAAAVSRHEVLRTTFAEGVGGVEQRIAAVPPRSLPRVDLETLPLARRAAEARRVAVALARRPFDLGRGPMLRTALVRLAADEHLLVLVSHHIVSDGWSVSVLFRDLAELYAAAREGRAAVLPELPVQYADFAVWQRAWLADERQAGHLEYWREHLAGAPPRLDLPTDRPRPAVQTFAGRRLPWRLDGATTADLHRVGAAAGTSLFMTVLAAFYALLGRHANQSDVVVGAPAAGRPRPEVESLVGCFINMLPLRLHLGGDPPFAELLAAVRGTVLDGFEHQDLPFERLVEALAPQRDLSQNPIFQVMFVLQDDPMAAARLVGTEVEPWTVDAGISRFDLTLQLAETAAGLEGWWEYNRDLFDATTVRRMAAHFTHLLRAVAAAPERRLHALPLLDAAQRHAVTRTWNDSARSVDAWRPVHGRFAAAAAEHPQRTALVCGDRTLTYGELDRASARLARRLRAAGLAPEAPVGVFCERSPEMVVAVLAVLRAGCAYLPLDPAFPADRLGFMLRDAAAPLVLVGEGLEEGVPAVAPQVLSLAESMAADEVDGDGDGAFRGDVHREALAYLIYTSGSTGRPKGVQVPHGAVDNFLRSMEHRLNPAPGDVLAAVTTLSFDIHVLELFLPLTTGGCVAVAGSDEVADGEALARLLERTGATRMQATPATWRLLLESGWRGSRELTVLCGGESLPRDLADRLLERGTALWNLYGPTETTVWSSVSRVGPGATVSLGAPLDNTELQVVDRTLRPTPPGVVGELLIGGLGVTRGYRGRPALTAERFVPDPFSCRPGARLYRTGDLVRRRPADGELEFHGRTDFQVKVRGFRIELGEVETALAARPEVAEAVVVARGGEGESRLVAYVVPAAGKLDADALRSVLGEQLPAYMVPSLFVSLEELPLTPNGKVDRRALPDPDPGGDRPRARYVRPSTPAEQAVAEVWNEVLGVERVGVEDSFFDLGGHSLLLARVHSRLRDRFPVPLTMIDLFRHPTVGALARYLSGEGSTASAAETGRRRARRRSRTGRGEAGWGDVAVVGLACRFPGAPDPESFWRNLRDGVESVRTFDDDELEHSPLHPPVGDEPGYVRAGGVVDGIEDFDPGFFAYSPAEASIVDPQQRVFLECAWQALEDAGHDPARFPGDVGVFAGAGLNTYFLHLAGDLRRTVSNFQALIGNDKDFLPTRVSYKLGLTGPSVNVQTACSTSLVAVHLAVRSLLDGECDMALAGGSSIRLPQRVGYFYQAGGILSPDGHCRAFDADGRGTVVGNGAGVVALRRLGDALADGDRVLAVIKGSAINNDGADKIGFTAPSIEGQAAVIAEAQQVAGVDPRTVGYVEAHGTATELGDPIEVAALTEAFGGDGDGDGPTCALGSVKSNIGHLDAAAGVAGLIKAVLALHRGAIPPSLHFRRPNPRIDFASGPFFVNRELRPWPAAGDDGEDGADAGTGRTPRRAGVSSFGLGGTNAHVVLEEAPPRPPVVEAREHQLLCLSAREPQALDALAERWAERLAAVADEPVTAFADLAYTSQVGRRAFPHRRCVVARGAAEAAAALRGEAPEQLLAGEVVETAPAVVFLFPGMGEQYPGMARGLYAAEPTFRAVVDEAAEVLAPHLDGRDPRRLLFDGDGERRRGLRGMLEAGGESGPLDATAVAHPLLFTVEVALARLLLEWGVRPAAMLGYSVGEYTAACIAGVLSFRTALELVARRARRIGELPRGAMLAVAAAEEELGDRLPAAVSVSAVTGRSQTVVAGPPEEVEELRRKLAADGVVSRPLRAGHAFHSPAMEPVASDFAALLAGVETAPPRIPYVSNLTGTWVEPEQVADPSYWARQMLNPVRFADGIDTLRGGGAPDGGGQVGGDVLFLEVGPGRGLASLVRQGDGAARVVATLPSAYEEEDDEAFLLRGVGRLWLAGVSPDWEELHRDHRRRRAAAPTYPFQRQRCWVEPRGALPAAAAPPVEARRKEEDVGNWFHVSRWRPAPLATARPAGGLWLLLVDEAGVGAALAATLRGGGRVVTASVGDRFEHRGDDACTLDPARREDWDELLALLGRRPDGIVHLWTVDQGLGAAELRRRAFDGPVHLVGRLAARGWDRNQVLLAASTALQPAGGDENLEPDKALLLGPLKVLPLEHEGVRCRSVDLEAGPISGEVGPEAAAGLLAAELADLAAAESPAVDEVAWRGGERLRLGFEARRLDRPDPAAEDTPLRCGGAYLITGGLGGIGLALGEHLARRWDANLVLLGRSEVPPRESWEDGGDGRFARLAALEREGTGVLALCADVTDRDAVAAAVAAAEERFGGIDGVLHAAGVPGSGLLQGKDPARATAVLAPKVEGTRVLATVLAGRGIGFLALFSSMNSVFGGGPGQADYAAANAFLDAFAHAAGDGLGRVVALDWSEWRWNAWRDGMQAFEPEVRRYLDDTRERLGITFEEGADALERALGAGLPRLFVSTRDAGQVAAEARRFTLGATTAASAATAAGAETRPTTPAAAGGDLERRMAALWRRLLGVERVALHDNFFDLGGNSLLGLQLVAEMKTELGVEVPAVALYDAPTVAALAALLRDGDEAPTAAPQALPTVAPDAPIAIVGMAGRFPGAGDVDAFWENLRQGVESITFFSDDELRAAGVPAELLADPAYVKAGSVLDDVDCFDAPLFGYSPREAETMDPQHRLFLECAWEALERAGHDPRRYPGRIGVVAGANLSTYLLGFAGDPEVLARLNPMQANLGNASDALPTRVSYKLGLRGPSFAVQTFCSTSGVAVHTACRSLQAGECDMALAGGVRVTVPHRVGYRYEAGGIDSPDGHTRAFDADGAGAVLGNGVAVVVLKRLDDAIAEGDHVHAVIRGTAMNNDGDLKVGFTAPSVKAQSEVVSEALHRAGVDPAAVGYVEAHGTGTALGDPIEIAALTRAFRRGTGERGYCAIGSVKTNVGHLDRAAGATGLIKAALAVEHGEVPPSLHFCRPNPEIPFEESPFRVATELAGWPLEGRRRAGLNVVGIGGTNVHMVLEQAPEPAPSAPARPWQAFLLSAAGEESLEALTDRLAGWLRDHPEACHGDVAHTLQVGRQVLEHRRYVVAEDAAAAAAALAERDPARLVTVRHDGGRPAVAFLFPGLGDHYPGMAGGLYRGEAVFRREVDRCAELLQPLLGLDLRQVLFADGEPGREDGSETGAEGAGAAAPDLRAMLHGRTADGPLDPTAIAQPATFVVELALARLLESWGVRPAAVAGYSLGEYAAACVAGVFTTEGALRVVAERARRIGELPPGAMLAVPLSPAEVEELLGDELSLAAVNGPELSVVAGPLQAVARLRTALEGEEIPARPLPTTHAFHSSMMEPLERDFARLLEGVELAPPRLPLLSNVTGTWIADDEATDPAYWARHLRHTVRFGDSVGELLADPDRLFLEVGPGQTLGSMVKQHPAYREARRPVVSTLPSAFFRRPDRAALLTAVARLWAVGVDVEWPATHAGRRRRVVLPTYPFARHRYWIDTATPAALRAGAAVEGKRADPAEWFYRPAWREAEPPAATDPEGAGWLLLDDDAGLADAVAAAAAGRGVAVVRVAAEEAVSMDRAGWARRLEELDPAPARIVDLRFWTGGGPAVKEGPEGGAEETAGDHFAALLAVLQAVAERQLVTTFTVVADGIHAVEGAAADPLLRAAKAPLLGLLQVAAQESPSLTCRSVDADAAAAAGDVDALVDELAADGAGRVALRGGRRLVQRFEPLHLAAPEAEGSGLRRNGTYLITGGLGGVALHLAEDLARRAAARLVLVGRSPLPPAEEWDGLLAAAEDGDEGAEDDDPTLRRIRRLRDVQAAGGEVMVVAADVTDEAALEAALTRAEQRFGPLDGVFHAAGKADIDPSHALLRLDRGACDAFFAAKVAGTRTLARVLAGRRPDFVLLFSSLSTVLGGLGFAAYSAANAYLDAFAAAQVGGSTRWLAVDWDTWLAGSGLVPSDGPIAGLESTVAAYAMTPQEGVGAVARILAGLDSTGDAGPGPRLVHSTGDLQYRLEQWVERRPRPAAGSSRPAARYARPELTTAFVAAGNDMERRIAEVWKRVLGVDEIGVHDNFFDLGGTSLSALELVAEMQRELDVAITPVTLFEAPTVAELGERLAPDAAVDDAAELRRRVEERRRPAAGGDIAIVGMAGRFPGADDVDALWRNLRAGVESLTELSDEDLMAAGVDEALRNDAHYVRRRPLVDGIEEFDAAFFGYSPREANFMSPQHRMLLECAWTALENAGYGSRRTAGRVGVFAGSNSSGYYFNLLSHPDLAGSMSELETAIAHDRDSLATSVSYKLDLRGPSMTVQTFCSTSAVATHLACRSLLGGECDMALAGGVSVRVPQRAGYLFQEGGQDSPDGHTRTFDHRARGTVFGDGVGVVVLKRLDDALEDGDTVYAVVKGSAMNNDGSGKAGYTAPSVDAQAEVVATALAAAGVEAADIGYLEAHGTATELGDPIEVEALTRAFRAAADGDKAGAAAGSCVLGSVKTNVGHLDRAAGVTGLIKTAEVLRHGEIPPLLHFEAPNPQIDLDGGPFRVVTELTPWDGGAAPRRAGVNSLGVGGTNVHLVLEEPPPPHPAPRPRPWQVLPLSARDETALEAATDRLADWLEEHPDTELADAAWTLQEGRRRFAHRHALVCRDGADARAALAADGRPRLLGWQAPSGAASRREVAFLLPGVGDHYPGMALGLYADEPVFRDELERCAAVVDSELEVGLVAALEAGAEAAAERWRDGGGGEGAAAPDLRRMLGRGAAGAGTRVETPLDRTAVAQPAVLAVELALARLLDSWGVRPAALLGFSLGEYTAACLAGVFSLADALRLVARRAALIETLPPGAMLAVSLGEEEATELAAGSGVGLAAVNGVSACVLSGPLEAVEELEARLASDGVAHRRLAASHAFHSPAMEPLADRFRALFRDVELAPPAVPFVSNLTGDWADPEEVTDPEYWLRHLCRPVRFAAGAERLLDGQRVLLEVGPGASLTSFVKQHPACPPRGAELALSTLRAGYDRQPDTAVLLAALARLWLLGVDVDWAGVQGGPRRRIPMPTYPFQRRRFWIEHSDPASAARPDLVTDPLEERKALEDWFYAPVWRQTPPPAPQPSPPDGPWLVLAGGSGTGAELAAELRRRGARVAVVEPGDAFAADGEEHRFRLRPASRADHEALVARLAGDDLLPRRVVHAWGLEAAEVLAPEGGAVSDGGGEELRRILDLGFHSLVCLVQALGEHRDGELPLTVLSSGLHRVVGHEAVRPELAVLLGPVRVVPLEYPGIACRSIDLATPVEGGRPVEAPLAALVADLCDGGEAVVAYRGGQRWVEDFQQLRLAPPVDGAGRLRDGGVYLITGGLGGIGLALAGYLARRYGARLVLVGRTGLPPRDAWDDLLAASDGIDDAAPVVARRLRAVRELETAGAAVEVVKADVVDRAQTRRAVRRAVERFGELHGVFHCAGVPAAGLMQLKTAESAERVMAPKVHGTRCLEQALEAELDGAQPDFLLLFSSITSVTGGGPGQVDYCAANAYLDAFASSRNGNGAAAGTTLSIDWGEWQWNAWEEGLEGFTPEVQELFRENRARYGITFDEGMEVVERALARGLPRVVASTQDFHAMIEASTQLNVANILARAQKSRGDQCHPRPTLGTSYVAPRNDEERGLAALWADMLALEEVGIDDNFFELGGNSLLGIDLVARMREELAMDVSTTAIYEAPSVRAMVELVRPEATASPDLDERRDRGALRRQRQAARRDATNRES